MGFRVCKWAEVPVKRVVGWVKGGGGEPETWVILYGPMFPLSHHITGGLIVRSPDCNAKVPRFESRTSWNRYLKIIEILKLWNIIETTASVTSISCCHMLHYISQCLSWFMASYHTAHAFPSPTPDYGSLMVSNPSCHAKRPSCESRSSQLEN